VAVGIVYEYLLVVIGHRHLNELGRRSNVFGQISPCRSVDVEVLQLAVYTGVSREEGYEAAHTYNEEGADFV
jgi:hypothetical protein